MKFDVSESYRWNQLEVIRNWTLKFLEVNKVKSLLDIGAGSAYTALRYSRAVDYYLGIEENEMRYSALKNLSLNVINASFPKINNLSKCQVVLSSHSLPEKKASLKEFIDFAWNLVLPRGYMIIITFKGANNTFRSIIEKIIKFNSFSKDDELHISLIKHLEQFGQPFQKIIKSYETTITLEDLVNHFCFILNNNDLSIRQIIYELLKNSVEFEGNKYKLPHEHLVVILEKLK